MFTIQNKNVEHNLLAIEVIHRSEINGNYACEFRAIPVDVAAPHYTDVEVFRKAESQSAVVIDNNDPEKLGRVKVAFYWASARRDSDWMRVTQQYSGTGRGSYCIPEIDDEVLVDFEGGNIDCPYVSASHYNGKANPEFFDPKNMIKGIKLRFGQLLKFVEKAGIWLSDPSGNEIHLDEEGKNINATTPETFTIRAKNIIFEATESITFNAGTNISETAALNKTTTVGGVLNTSVIGDSFLHIQGTSHENIDGDLNSHTNQERNEIGLNGIVTSSEKDLNNYSKNNIQHNSGESTKQN